MRLLACASCRLLPHLLTDDCLQRALEKAEEFVENPRVEDDLVRLRERAHALGMARGELLSTMLSDAPDRAVLVDSWRIAHAVACAAGPEDGSFGNAMHYAAQDGGSGRDTEDPGQSALIREMLGNPLRPVTLFTEWRTNLVQSLAHQMYDNHDFSCMPILADALQDAGCDNEDVLNHCRQPGEHCRGCWVVDLLFDKK
jgi:hypothetical protein